MPGGVAQSVMCLATDAILTADPGGREFDPWRLITVILLPSAESFKKGYCQLQAKVCVRSTG